MKLRIASVGKRYVSYVVDLVFLGCISTIILAPFRISSVFFLGSFSYFQGIKALSSLPSHDVILTSISFFFLATGYFLSEPYLNTSVGKFLFNQKIVILKRSNSYSRHKYFKAVLARALVKAVPPVNLIDCLFIFKYKRFSQRYTDKCNGFVVIEKSNPLNESRLLFAITDYLILSAIIYYLPLVTGTMSTYFSSAHSPLSQGSNGAASSNTSISVGNVFYGILRNNLNLDLSLMLGGVALLSLSLLVVFSSSFIEGTLLSLILKSQPSAIISGILPHFFFETGGYIAGIAVALLISIIVLEWGSAYAQGKSFGDFAGRNFINVKSILLLILLSIILIIIGALIEASMS